MKKVLVSVLLGSSLLAASAFAQKGEAQRWSDLPGLDPVPVQSWTNDQGDEMLQRDMTDVIRLLGYDKAAHDHSEAASLAESISRPHPSVASVERMFRAAAAEFDVPAPLLMAIGQVENNWTQLGPTIDGGWGIMHLVENHHTNTLADAAERLGVDVEQVRNDPRTNIRGAAALLRQYWHQVNGKRMRPSHDLETWFEPSKLFSGLYTEETRQLHGKTYFERLAEGGEWLTLWGENVTLEPQQGFDLESLKAKSQPAAKSADYGPATFYPVSCYNTGRSSSITTWVNHYIQAGTYASTISVFQSCHPVYTDYDRRVSSHFLVGQNGDIAQFVPVADTAWHAVSANPYSIGVEHEATSANPSQWNTTAMLQASADLASHFADVYSIPRVRGNPGIIGHKEVVATLCPANLPWETWMAMFNGGGGGGGGGSSNWANFVYSAGSVPTSINPGQALPVTVRLKNTGTTTWTAGSLFRLGADTGNGFQWTGMQCGGYYNEPGDSRVELCHSVAPGNTHDFSFYIYYPQGVFSGTADLSMQMVQDGVEWFGESYTQIVNVAGGNCGCGGGTSYWGQSIPAGDTWCGFKVCGLDNQLYTCGGSWSGTGSYGCSSCRCSGGYDYLGNEIDPDYTYCGFEVCGSDHKMYRCTTGGQWDRLESTTCP